MVPDKAQHNPCCEKGNCQPLPTEHPSSSNADGVDLNNCTICSKVEVLVMKMGCSTMHTTIMWCRTTVMKRDPQGMQCGTATTYIVSAKGAFSFKIL